MANVELMAPGQYTMNPVLPKNFDKHTEGLLVKQTAKGCLQSCLGCQAKSEYKVSGMDWSYIRSSGVLTEGAASLPNELYVLEDSNPCMRFCWRDGRSMVVNISEGGEEGGAHVASFTKSCGNPLYFTVPIPYPAGDSIGIIQCILPCCCALPQFVGRDAANNEINQMTYDCDIMYCVGKFTYFEDGQPVYKVAPDTCCGGCCIMPRKNVKGGKWVVPFYFRNPETGEKLSNSDGNNPQIAKVWVGLKKECCTTADTFATLFPDGCDARRKTGLLGLTILLDFTMFERQQQAQEGL